jgi:glycosyltransferase involved in cell wall biosynthesis
MRPLSVVIITLNEEKNIARCLESVKNLADEILVVDSFSTDATKSICIDHGVTFLEQSFLGYIEQKNFALGKAKYDFVLSLDADEALDETLCNSIAREKTSDFPVDAYTMNRLSYYCGKWIRHGTWYPDTKLRLLNRHKGNWGGTNPHDKLEMQNGIDAQHLKGDILHYTYYTMEEHMLQANKFSTIAAKAMNKQGKKSNWFKILVNPAIAFLTSFVIKGGFLDGFYGYCIARTHSFQTFQKYIKLMQIQRQGRSDDR